MTAPEEHVFSLEGKALKLDTAESIEPYVKPLLSPNASTKITAVNLSGNTIGVDAAAAFASHIQNLTALESANFADIFTGRKLPEIPPALNSLLQALLALEKLHTINLNDNAFGLNTQEPLVEFLEKHVPLKHLYLNNNGLGPEAGTLVADALSRLAVEKAKSDVGMLETVVCGRNRLENGSMTAWARAYTAHADDIREVKMVQNGIRPEGIRTLLLEGLRKAKRLRVLDLQDNTFTRHGSQALATVLGGWTDLIELGVSESLVSARGMVLIVEALQKTQNGSIEVLRLQYNEIDAKSLKLLNSALETGALPNLRRVELNGNKLNENDPAIDRLRKILHERGEHAHRNTDIPYEEDEDWGLDDLDELEGEDSDQDDDEEGSRSAQEEEVEQARILHEADEAEAANTAEKPDTAVDALANQLEKSQLT